MPLKWVLGLSAAIMIVAVAQGRVQTLRVKRDVANKSKSICREVKDKDNDELQVVCSHLHSLQEVLGYFSKEQLQNITTLTLAQSNLNALSLDDIADLSSLHTLIFNQSLISEWGIPKTTTVPKIKVLILDDCWNRYNLVSTYRNASLQFTPGMFDGLPLLEELHLITCYVTNMTTGVFRNAFSLKKLKISGSGIGCEPYMDWVLDWIIEGKAEVSKDTVCFVAKDLDEGGGVLVMSTYYSLNGHPFLLIMNHRKETKSFCPKECTCSLEGFNIGRHSSRNSVTNDPIIKVNCANAGLTSLPNIPPYSTRLEFANNSIVDISPLFTNELYRNVTSIRLEHNNVSCLDGDLFYNFLKNRPFDLLIGLSYNNLSTLPVKQMMQVYQDAQTTGSYKPLIHLEFNPWDCSSCEFLPGFQELVYYQYYTYDKESKSGYIRNIRCAEGSEFTGQLVIQLDVQTLCAPEPPLLEGIDILNICLALFIIFVVADFVYNFYQYRQNSRLPWIITKVPCC